MLDIPSLTGIVFGVAALFAAYVFYAREYSKYAKAL